MVMVGKRTPAYPAGVSKWLMFLQGRVVFAAFKGNFIFRIKAKAKFPIDAFKGYFVIGQFDNGIGFVGSRLGFAPAPSCNRSKFYVKQSGTMLVAMFLNKVL